MQHDDFIGQVQHRAQLASRGEAERISRLVLETIGERIDEAAAHKIAAQLPVEIGRHLIGAPMTRLSYLQLLNRLSVRERGDLREASEHARAVMSVVREAVSPSLIHHLEGQLPSDFAPLFHEMPAPLGEWTEPGRVQT